jgi:hypothetical protein
MARTGGGGGAAAEAEVLTASDEFEHPCAGVCETSRDQSSTICPSATPGPK